MRKLMYIDIFAGCGGLSLGLQNAGWTGLFAVEKNKDAFSTLEYNLIKNRGHFEWPDWIEEKEIDINELLKEKKQNLESLQGEIDLLAGGPPCQGFSMAGKRDKNDARNKLVKAYIKFVKTVKPATIVFENVNGFTMTFKDKNGKEKKYSNYVVNALKRQGYKVESRIIDMTEYGIPQKRKRFILIASQKYNPKDIFSRIQNNRDDFLLSRGIAITNNVKDAIGDIEKKNGVVDSPDSFNFKAGVYGAIQSGYQAYLRRGVQGNVVDSHRFVNHTDRIVKLHKELQQKAPKGKRITPSDNYSNLLKRRGVTVLSDTMPAPTITSIPDELIHYDEPRILTVREHARIQSFPDWYKFKGKYTSGGKRRKQEVPRYTQVGNAVPPLFAEQIGEAIKEVIENERKKIII
ncbi:MAG: DNA cytosine methyltransferase [Clostridiaceae bacterium]|nr:DNA cytosine methyltransferase [Clostridiaceae bacterium]